LGQNPRILIGTPARFPCGKQIASYVGMVPSEESSGDRRRLGHISKQATHCCAICWWKRPRLRCAVNRSGGSKFFHLAMRRGRKIAKVAMARKLAVHLYWMWRQGWDYEQFSKLGSYAGVPGHPHGVQ